MRPLDMRTVLASYALLSLVCSAVMARQWRSHRGRYAGLGCWLANFLLQFLGLVLIATRDRVPDLVSMTLGNAAILIGFALLLRGLRQFFGLSGRAAVDWAAIGLFLGAHAYFVAIRPSLRAREVVFSLAMIFVCARGFVLLSRVERGLRASASTVRLTLSLFWLLSLGRIALDLAMPSKGDFLSDPSFDSLVLVAYMALFVSLTFSLVTMIGRRLVLEQEKVIEEKNRAESALRSSEELFSKAFQASPEAIAISRVEDGRFVEVNEGFCRISGYPREEVLGEPPIDVWGDPDARRAFVAELLANPIVRRYETSVVRKGGERLRIELSGGIVELDGKKHLLTISRDLTERERAAAVLRLRLELREFAIGHSVEELMSKALEEIESMTASRVGFYHFVDEDRGMLTRQAWSRRTLVGACRADSGDEHYPIERAGVWADCIRERKPVVHNDYASLPNRRGLPQGHFQVERELVAPTLRDGKVVAILGVGNKASDYTEEDVSLVSFMADLVWGLVAQKRAEEVIRELNRDLERLAMTDELTGIANRRAFFAFADRELKKARRYSEPISFLMMDIDHFKLVNDRYGHDAGDAALKTAALIVQNHVRGVDVAARLGGEEFGILMPNTALADAARSAERLRATVAEASCDLEDASLRMTISVGVASLGGSATDLDSIMKAADEALYRAKAGGRDRVETA